MDLLEHMRIYGAWSLRNYVRINRLTQEPAREAYEFGYLLLWCIRYWHLIEQFVDRSLSSQDAEYFVEHLYRGQHGVRSRYLKVIRKIASIRQDSLLDIHTSLSGLVTYSEAWEPDEYQVKTVHFFTEALRALTTIDDLIISDQVVRSRITGMLEPWFHGIYEMFSDVVMSKQVTVGDLLDEF